MKKKKLNIKKAIKKPGALRSALGIKAGKKIPASKFESLYLIIKISKLTYAKYKKLYR